MNRPETHKAQVALLLQALRPFADLRLPTAEIQAQVTVWVKMSHVLRAKAVVEAFEKGEEV